MADDDVALPKATIAKIIKDILPEHIRCGNDARDAIVTCCTEFIHLVTSEANTICDKKKKKTITPEEVIEALQSLGFDKYVEGAQQAATAQREEAKLARNRRTSNKLEDSGIPIEELKRRQEELFAKARAEYESSASFQAAEQAAEQSTGQEEFTLDDSLLDD